MMNICFTHHVRAKADKMHCLVDCKSKINFLPQPMTNKAELLQYREEKTDLGDQTVILLNVFFGNSLLFGTRNRKRSFIML